jgi:hypothetical protein
MDFTLLPLRLREGEGGRVKKIAGAGLRGVRSNKKQRRAICASLQYSFNVFTTMIIRIYINKPDPV